jgi:23S rRNA (uracil1939-C5)-methyltransferase
LWWEPEDEGLRRKLYDRRSDRSPSASFAQVNAEVAAELRGFVVSRITSLATLTAVDAYSGAGHTAIALADFGIVVTAIELDADAAEWAGQHLSPPSRAVHGRVEDALPAHLPADIVILNPPRAGLDVRVTEILQAHAATTRRLIYISCNPATLARDVSRLPGFRIESLHAFDMFPQTAHVETVCELISESPA